MGHDNTSKVYKSNPITEWSLSERPRERMTQHGPSALADAELIAIIFSTGSLEKSAVDLGRDLLALAGNDLAKLSRMSQKALEQVKGVGPAKAIRLMAALELGRRRRDSPASRELQISSSRGSANLLMAKMQDLLHEEFHILYLNRRNVVLHHGVISKGGMSATVVDVRIILKEALALNAVSIILAHNHPSGNLQPSDQDNAMTKKIQDAAKIMDISVLDHIIVAGSGYYSYADEGRL